VGIEIERKFLVKNSEWETATDSSVECSQGYLTGEGDVSVRVRIIGEKAFLTVKGATHGITRPEYEYEIPVADGAELLQLCGQVVEKTRYYIKHNAEVWELDVFAGSNDGLIMAEIELKSEGQEFRLPAWVGREVSNDPRYRNGNLARQPFSTW
jgi:adenylate cyclase